MFGKAKKTRATQGPRASESTHLLANIIAAGDAPFLPCRNWNEKLPAVLYERRRAFADGGVPWTSAHLAGAHDDGTRKSAQRRLADLNLQRLVTLRIPRARTLATKLTEQGDTEARTRCGLPTIADAQELASKMLSLEIDHRCCHDTAGLLWIPEPILCEPETKWGAPGHEQALSRLELRMLPLLVRGWAISTSDLKNRAWYALTPKGIAADFVGPSATTEEPGAFEVYIQRLRAELADLATSSPADSRELGLIPFSCSPCDARQSARQPVEAMQ